MCRPLLALDSAQAICNCLRLFRQAAFFALVLAAESAGSSRAAKMATRKT